MNDLDRSILTYSEAGRAALAEIERLTKERDAEKARADAAEQMVAELRAIISEAADDLDREEERHASDGDGFDTTTLAHTLAWGRATLARTEPVAGRWVPATERDAARAEVERLRAALRATVRDVGEVEAKLERAQRACRAALPHHQGGHSAVGRLLRDALRETP